MRRQHVIRTRAALSGLAFAAVAVTACSSSAGSASSASGGGTAAASSPSAGHTAQVAAAQQAIAPYVGPPSPFPATQTLAKLVCRRALASNGLIRTSRCTPASVFIQP